MKLTDLCDVLDVELDLKYYPNQNGRWVAKLSHAEISEGGFLTGVHGNGKTPEEAINDYVAEIKGQRVIFNAYSDDRKEFVMPENLEGV